MKSFDRCVLLAYLLNASDVLLTIALVAGYKQIEANPAMALLLALHPVAFAATKLVVVGLLCLLLRRQRRRSPETAEIGLGVVIGMLVMICLWQTWLLLWIA